MGSGNACEQIDKTRQRVCVESPEPTPPCIALWMLQGDRGWSILTIQHGITLHT